MPEAPRFTRRQFLYFGAGAAAAASARFWLPPAVARAAGLRASDPPPLITPQSPNIDQLLLNQAGKFGVTGSSESEQKLWEVFFARDLSGSGYYDALSNTLQRSANNEYKTTANARNQILGNGKLTIQYKVDLTGYPDANADDIVHMDIGLGETGFTYDMAINNATTRSFAKSLQPTTAIIQAIFTTSILEQLYNISTDSNLSPYQRAKIVVNSTDLGFLRDQAVIEAARAYTISYGFGVIGAAQEPARDWAATFAILENNSGNSADKMGSWRNYVSTIPGLGTTVNYIDRLTN